MKSRLNMKQLQRKRGEETQRMMMKEVGEGKDPPECSPQPHTGTGADLQLLQPRESLRENKWRDQRCHNHFIRFLVQPHNPPLVNHRPTMEGIKQGKTKATERAMDPTVETTEECLLDHGQCQVTSMETCQCRCRHTLTRDLILCICNRTTDTQESKVRTRIFGLGAHHNNHLRARGQNKRMGTPARTLTN